MVNISAATRKKLPSLISGGEAQRAGIVMALILTSVNIVIGMILCQPIKKINPYSLIKE